MAALKICCISNDSMVDTVVVSGRIIRCSKQSISAFVNNRGRQTSSCTLATNSTPETKDNVQQVLSIAIKSPKMVHWQDSQRSQHGIHLPQSVCSSHHIGIPQPAVAFAKCPAWLCVHLDNMFPHPASAIVKHCPWWVVDCQISQPVCH